MIKLRTSLSVLILVVACSIPAFSETIHCTQCGMTVDMDSKFTAKIVRADTALYFCDIGDLFSYLKKNDAKEGRPEVKDYDTGEWIDAGKAYYVHAENKFRTPMGWGIAAFKERKNAEAFGGPADFEAAAKSLK